MALETTSDKFKFTDATNGTTISGTSLQVLGSLGVTQTLVSHGSRGITSETGTDLLLYCASNQTIQLTGPVNINTSCNLVGGVTSTINVYTADQTLGSSQYIVVANKATAIAFTLPAATASSGRSYRIKNIGVGVLTVNRAGSDTIDGGTSVTLNQYDEKDIISLSASTWGVF